jgi:tetratricopeptide (TPR) repeat protein
MRRRRTLAVLGAIALAVVLAGGIADGDPTPERIVSMRNRFLRPERYAELRQEWKAYTETHPNDPLGWSQLAKAARYAGAPCEEYIKYAEKAVRLAPNNAEACATLGSYRWCIYCASEPQDPREAIRLLERALQLDPSLDDPHYTLWVMRLSQGQRAEADAHLRTLLDRGRMPEPLVDFGHNLLVGLEPNAILLTNGDNDTYPLVALQTARKFRTDVAVVNLSLLNIEWYRRDLRNGRLAVPVPLLEKSTEGIKSWTPSRQAVKGLLESLQMDGWKRPLYAAATVGGVQELIPNRLSLEGVVYRVLPTSGGEPEIDTKSMARNLDKLYRLSSATSLALDWEAWSSLRPLMLNYCAAAIRLAPTLAQAGDLMGARAKMSWALDLSEFHHSDPKTMRELIGAWSQWDPRSPELARWKEKYSH